MSNYLGELLAALVVALWLLIVVVGSRVAADSIEHHLGSCYREARFVADWFHEQRMICIRAGTARSEQ